MSGPGLPLTEVFGPTIQGEGPASGRPAAFVRFGGCNLACTWCDTPYTWDSTRFDLRSEISRRPIRDVLGQLASIAAPVVVLTGGEPLLHQGNPAWPILLDGLRDLGREVHIETNGTVAPSAITARRADLVVVSPKLRHADADRRTGQATIVPAVLRDWSKMARQARAAIKVVVRTTDDCRAAVDVAQTYGFPLSSVWLMPEGVTTGDLRSRWRMVAEFAAAHGVNASHRLHVLAWNDERGH